MPFPLHHKKDFVELHAEGKIKCNFKEVSPLIMADLIGFKGKKNIDLFKHYLRMYMKNHHKVKIIKKERLEKATRMSKIEESVEKEINAPKSIRLSVLDDILEGIETPPSTTFYASNSTSMVKNSSFFSNFRRSQELIQQRLNLQGFVMEHSLNNLEFYSSIIEEYEARAKFLSIDTEDANKHL